MVAPRPGQLLVRHGGQIFQAGDSTWAKQSRLLSLRGYGWFMVGQWLVNDVINGCMGNDNDKWLANGR